MNRQEANIEILNKLSLIVGKHPDLRFTQILTTLDLDTDKFNEEPVITLKSTDWSIYEL